MIRELIKSGHLNKVYCLMLREKKALQCPNGLSILICWCKHDMRLEFFCTGFEPLTSINICNSKNMINRCVIVMKRWDSIRILFMKRCKIKSNKFGRFIKQIIDYKKIWYKLCLHRFGCSSKFICSEAIYVCDRTILRYKLIMILAYHLKFERQKKIFVNMWLIRNSLFPLTRWCIRLWLQFIESTNDRLTLATNTCDTTNALFQ